MDRDEMIQAMAALIAGLAVPVSMKMPLGTADQAWTTLHRGLVGFGWAVAADYEREIRKVLA